MQLVKYWYCVLFNCAACVQLSHALGCHMTARSHLVKMQSKLSNKSLRIGETGACLDEWTWSCWPRQKLAQRERWGLLFSSAQRWHWGHRGQHDPCDPHVTPLYNRYRSESSSALLKFPEMKKRNHMQLWLQKKIIFYWQQYIRIQNLQIVMVKKRKHKYT